MQLFDFFDEDGSGTIELSELLGKKSQVAMMIGVVVSSSNCSSASVIRLHWS
jgi:hypothetical protein